jgi:glycosyltransferase involved in cell wall biosynthesis
VTGYQAASDQSIFAHLEDLLNNPALRQELGRNGRRLSKKYDWDVITAQWEEAFAQSARQRQMRKAS